MRVSLPISTVGRLLVRRNTRPTAWPRRSMKSGVMGDWPTVPRMPSVPKYCRVMSVLFLVVVLRGRLLCQRHPPHPGKPAARQTFRASTVAATSCTRST